MTREEIKSKLLQIKSVLPYASIGSIGGNYTYTQHVTEVGIDAYGYSEVNGTSKWGLINTPWDSLTDEDFALLERFVKLKFPKDYVVTRDSYLITFKNPETNEAVTVNLRDKKFTKTYANGKQRDIKYPHSFFKGMEGRVVATKIPSDDNFRKLVDTIIRKESACSNFGTFLVRLLDNIHLETYISAGVKFDYNITVGYDFFDKDVRAVLNNHDMQYNTTVERFFSNNHDLGKSMLYFIKDEADFQNVFYAIAQNMRDIVNLVDNYKYDVKRLFEYCKERDWSSGRNRWYGRDLVSFLNDYARMADLVFPNGFDKYPKDIIDHHDGVSKLYQKEQIRFNDEKYAKRIDPKMEFENKDYCIIFPKSTGDIQSEGRLLSHCVGSYVNSVIEGHTTILFMRLKTEKDTPLVTVEVRDGRVAQARGKFNRALSYDERMFLTEYAEKKKLSYVPPRF